MSKTQQMQREENILQFLLDTTPKFKLKVLELFCLLQHFWEGHQEHLMDGTRLCCEWDVAWAGWGVVLCLCSRPEKIYLVLFWGGCEKGGSNKCRNKRILGICLMWPLFSLEQADGILESLWEKLVSPEEGLSPMQIRDKQRPDLLLQML